MPVSGIKSVVYSWANTPPSLVCKC